MTKRLLSWESQFVQQISYSSTALIIAISDRALHTTPLTDHAKSTIIVHQFTHTLQYVYVFV